jgi:hypothetical protein
MYSHFGVFGKVDITLSQSSSEYPMLFSKPNSWLIMNLVCASRKAGVIDSAVLLLDVN